MPTIGRDIEGFRLYLNGPTCLVDGGSDGRLRGERLFALGNLVRIRRLRLDVCLLRPWGVHVGGERENTRRSTAGENQASLKVMLVYFVIII